MSQSGYTAWNVTAGEVPTTAYWNILGYNDASFNTGNGFNDGIIIARHFAAGAAGTTAVRPNYLQATGNTNGTTTRSVSSSNYLVPGTILTYTTGSTNELLQIWGYGLVQAVGGGCGMIIQINGTNVGRRTYTENTNYESHYPTALFLASANTTYTIRMLVLASGSTTICDATNDTAQAFQGNLEMIAWGKS